MLLILIDELFIYFFFFCLLRDDFCRFSNWERTFASFETRVNAKFRFCNIYSQYVTYLAIQFFIFTYRCKLIISSFITSILLDIIWLSTWQSISYNLPISLNFASKDTSFESICYRRFDESSHFDDVFVSSFFRFVCTSYFLFSFLLCKSFFVNWQISCSRQSFAKVFRLLFDNSKFFRNFFF